MNKKLIGVLSRVFNLPESMISDDMSRDDVSNWDSLKQMDLVVSLENEFLIELKIDEIIQLDSVTNIKKVLTSRGVDFGN